MSRPPSTELASHRRFEFVADHRPLVRGPIVGLALIGCALFWAWSTDRIHRFDPTYAAVLVVSFGVALSVALGRTWQSARVAATALGAIELDDVGIRWRRGDGSIGFDVAWDEVKSAILDHPNSTLVVRTIDDRTVLLGALSEHGVPSGNVVIERFDELVARFESRSPTAAHEGNENRSAGRPAMMLGVIGCLVAIALYLANLTLAHVLDWTRLSMPLPLFVGAVSLLGVVAGIRIHRGSGPLVSPMYGPSYRTTVIRFLTVASIANFVLVAVVNTVAM